MQTILATQNTMRWLKKKKTKIIPSPGCGFSNKLKKKNQSI